jgi:ubiquitin-protein ligase
MPDVKCRMTYANRSAERTASCLAVPASDVSPSQARAVAAPAARLEAKESAYRLHSLTLGRALSQDETLGSAGVPEGDRLVLAVEITARAVAMGESPRIRRLRADHVLMQELDARSDLISVRAITARPSLPVERYIVSFQCKSIVDVDRQGNPRFDSHHQVEIYLHNQYPQRWPGMKWLTPIWHPNINHLNGSVCIDAAWWTASRSLDRLVVMLGEMLQWKNFHDDPTKPPFPWDPEAARWSREYRKKHPKAFPVDHRELLRPERVKIKPAREVPKHRPRVRLK